MANEQAALLRVAGLVAAASAPQVVFDAVTAEASELLGGRPVTLVRYDSDHELVVLAAQHGPVAVGTVIISSPTPSRIAYVARARSTASTTTPASAMWPWQLGTRWPPRSRLPSRPPGVCGAH